VRLHPAVDEVVTVASRRWRRAPFAASTWTDVRKFMSTIRSRGYDEVIDTQGLLRTALITRLAHGRRHGYDRKSIRERLACPFYDVRHRVSRALHAIARNRALTGHALGYGPAGDIDFGLDRARLADTAAAPYGILLHATARPRKEWPEERWIALGRSLGARGLELLLPWGHEAERLRSERIAAAVPGARVLERQPLDAIARRVAGAQVVVGVDTGLLHLAAALGVPLVGIFVGSEPGLTGPMGHGPIAIVGGKGEVPETRDVLDALDGLGRLTSR
jgi:heptosyltransferase-1